MSISEQLLFHCCKTLTAYPKATVCRLQYIGTRYNMDMVSQIAGLYRAITGSPLVISVAFLIASYSYKSWIYFA